MKTPLRVNAKKYTCLRMLLEVLAFCLVSNSVWSQKMQARIKIDAERKIGEIDKMIYGNFVEHLGRCIYGGLYEPGSRLSDKDGYRKDVIEATKDLKVSIVRWPGGNFVSGYHWQDGIGPVKERPTRIDLAWGFRENNSFGTDEFVGWCRKVNTEPYFCVNLGTGSLDEARNWVEYCNIDSGTYYADLRIRNGHKQPFNVKYWGLGNEIDGTWQMGHKNAEDYGKTALEAAKLMKWIDKDIKLVASGSSNLALDYANWNRTILDYLKDHVDYISLHNYTGNRNNDYYEFMASTLGVEKYIKATEGIINEEVAKSNRKSPIYIAFDEYNVWYRAKGNEGNEENYNLEDALVVAGYLNIFVRNAQIVKMANMAQLVNVIAPIFTTKDGLFFQTIYYPLSLFANNCHGVSLDVYVDCDTYQMKDKQVPYLDVSSAYNKDKDEIIINVVNRHQEKSISTQILSQYGSFKGNAAIYEVNSKNIKDKNSMTQQLIKTKTNQINVRGDNFLYSFPAHSFTMIVVPLEKNG